MKIVIEIDGRQHRKPGALPAMLKELRISNSRRYLVLRFWNNEVLRETARVMQSINAAIAEAAGVRQD